MLFIPLVVARRGGPWHQELYTAAEFLLGQPEEAGSGVVTFLLLWLASVARWKAGYVEDEKYEEFGEWLLENLRLLNSWGDSGYR